MSASTRSTRSRPYHERSKTVISPWPGITGRKRQRKWWRSSVVGGRPDRHDATWRGSMPLASGAGSRRPCRRRRNLRRGPRVPGLPRGRQQARGEEAQLHETSLRGAYSAVRLLARHGRRQVQLFDAAIHAPVSSPRPWGRVRQSPRRGHRTVRPFGSLIGPSLHWCGERLRHPTSGAGGGPVRRRRRVWCRRVGLHDDHHDASRRRTPAGVRGRGRHTALLAVGAA